MEGPPNPAGIARLEPTTVSRLRSSSIVRGLAQCVEELVCNSLDAGASSVSVSIDIAQGSISASVEDDGCGVRPADMRILGQRHATSKLSSLQELEAGPVTLGFKGEALASLAGGLDATRRLLF